MTATALQTQIEALECLLSVLSKASGTQERLDILNEQPQVKDFLSAPSSLRTYLAGLTPDCDLAIKSILAIGQGAHVFRNMDSLTHKFEALREMIKILLDLEKYYDTIGGIIGYHLTVLKLIAKKETKNGVETQTERFIKPEGIDVSQDTPEVRRCVRYGIEHVTSMAEIYPVGGAGDRLNLVDEKSGEPLPAAQLPFYGRPLLAGLIRDLQAREYLHYKLCGKKVITPVAMMTSHEKNNHEHILDICRSHHWFGRPPESFRFFTQPLVPVITKTGDWSLSAPLQLMLKPGGHGVIWKLAIDNGIFEWFRGQQRNKALVRQINNPAAGSDYGLLALCGKGEMEHREFGFASCSRLLNTAEGMNVLIETEKEGGVEYRISNIEYTEFEQKGVADIPTEPGGQYSVFPANTNILFIDLEAVEKAVKECPIPGMLVNMKNKTPFIDAKGQVVQVEGGRLESTMQNIADFIRDKEPLRLDQGGLGSLKTFVTYNSRRKTISVTKKAFVPGKGILETPEGCFFELQQNCHEMLVDFCKMDLPSPPDEATYLKQGPAVLVLFHPIIGPLYSVIAQKIYGGSCAQGSELQLEIAEVELKGIDLDGSLSITAKEICSGKCTLRNVKIRNKGIDRAAENRYWKNQIQRKESLKIILEGNGEFHAEDVTIVGDKEVIVPDNHRMVARQEGSAVVFDLQKIEKATWSWEYTWDVEDRVTLSRRE